MDIANILEECGINNLSAQDFLKKIAEKEEFYTHSEIIEIYNYLLSNTNKPDILIGIIKFANSYKNPETLNLLIDILLNKKIMECDEDELINLRVQCAKAISNYKDTSTVTYLLKCLNNKNENYKIRLACADALGRVGDRFAVAPLINILEDEDEKSVYVKESATFALGLLGDTSAIDPLVSIMEAKQGLMDKFSFLKEKIIEVLGKLTSDNKNVFRVLKSSLMDSSSMVRINAIEALMNSDYNEAESLIRTALHDNDEEVQKNALIALYNMIGRDILDEVISLPGYSENLKTEAKNIIEEYEDEE